MTDLETTPQQKRYKILLVGDTCTDIYQYGTVDRISPEAPVPVFKFSYEEHRAGMAGNVLTNLEALGCEVDFLHGDVSTKTRLIDLRSKQQIVRIDNDAISATAVIDKDITQYDAIVVSDYNKGTVSYELVEELIQQAGPGKVFVDTKKADLYRFQGAWVKINELEFSQIKSECSGLIVTLGSKGAVCWEDHYPAPSVEVTDVTGAGDTFLAALTFCYLQTQSIEDAIRFAIKASTITVQHVGVYAPTLEEIE